MVETHSNRLITIGYLAVEGYGVFPGQFPLIQVVGMTRFEFTGAEHDLNDIDGIGEDFGE